MRNLDIASKFLFLCKEVDCPYSSISKDNQLNFVQALQGTITSLIHPSCKLSESATILKGCILLSNVVLCDHVTIGRRCLLHKNIIIENDTIVENFTIL